MAVRNSYVNALHPMSQLRKLRGVVLFWKSADERGGRTFRTEADGILAVSYFWGRTTLI